MDKRQTTDPSGHRIIFNGVLYTLGRFVTVGQVAVTSISGVFVNEIRNRFLNGERSGVHLIGGNVLEFRVGGNGNVPPEVLAQMWDCVSLHANVMGWWDFVIGIPNNNGQVLGVLNVEV